MVARGERIVRPVECAEYNSFIDKGIDWKLAQDIETHRDVPESVLEGEAKEEGGLYKTAYLHSNIPQAGKGGEQEDHYMYSFHFGVGCAKDSQLFIECDRKKGKGLGQQFRVNFYDKDDSAIVLRSYWIIPNQRCTTKSPFAAAQVGHITVDYRL
jgi:hypothetical protein